MKKWLIIAGIVLALLVVLGMSQRQSRLSYVVAIVSDQPAAKKFLLEPGISFVEGYVRFNSDLPEDVFFGLDQEWVEGVRHPIHVKGGDWMAFVGIQRTGAIWARKGTDKTMGGEPSGNGAWHIASLGQALQPNTWYKIRHTADFSKREFVEFEIEGPGVHKKLDLRGIKVDYPNMIPFDDPCLTYYCGAFRGRSMMKPGGPPVVYYDDIKGGIVGPDGKDNVLFASDFEEGSTILKQPITYPEIHRDKYQQGKWYFERDEALFRIIEVPFARSGKHVGEANASLDR